MLKIKIFNKIISVDKKHGKFVINAEFKESEHPRDKDGKFTDGSGGSGGGKSEINEKYENEKISSLVNFANKSDLNNTETNAYKELINAERMDERNEQTLEIIKKFNEAGIATEMKNVWLNSGGLRSNYLTIFYKGLSNEVRVSDHSTSMPLGFQYFPSADNERNNKKIDEIIKFFKDSAEKRIEEIKEAQNFFDKIPNEYKKQFEATNDGYKKEKILKKMLKDTEIKIPYGNSFWRGILFWKKEHDVKTPTYKK